MRGFVPRHLVLRKSFIAHTLCLACPDFKIRLGHFTFTHAGKVFFIRPLVDFPNVVVVDLLFETFCRAYFATGLSALPRCSIQDEPTVRVIAQSKNSLAPEGKSIAFELDPEHGFQWKGACEITVDELLSGGGQVQTKTMQMEDELKKMLNAGEISAEAIRIRADELGISERTLKIAKKNLGIVSAKRGDQWYWKLTKGVRV